MIDTTVFWVIMSGISVLLILFATPSITLDTKPRQRPTWVYSDSDRTFGTPGKALHSVKMYSKKNVYAGKVGERRAASLLEEVLENHPNAYVFHSMKLPGHTGDMDHVIVQGRKMILVDTKKWKSKSTYTVSPYDPGKILRDGQSFSGGKLSLLKQHMEWSEHYQPDITSCEAVLLIASDDVTVEANQNALPYTLTNEDDFPELISEMLNDAEETEPLTEEQLSSYLNQVFGYDFIHTSQTRKAPGIH